MSALLPFSNYVVSSAAIPLVTSQWVGKESSHYLCKKTSTFLLEEMLSTIICTEVAIWEMKVKYSAIAFHEMSELTLSSLQVGPLLWRHIDHRHQNTISAQEYKIYNIEFIKWADSLVSISRMNGMVLFFGISKTGNYISIVKTSWAFLIHSFLIRETLLLLV